MKIIEIIIIAFISLFLVALDISFFSSFTFFGANLLISLVVAILFAISLSTERYLTFCSFSALFFILLSSLPPYGVAFGFIILPGALRYFKMSFFPEPTVLTSLIYFVIGLLLFEIILIIPDWQLSLDTLPEFAYFILINSLAGSFLFYLLLRIKRFFLPGQIKL